jgi:homoserine O-acetyltransferase
MSQRLDGLVRFGLWSVCAAWLALAAPRLQAQPAAAPPAPAAAVMEGSWVIRDFRFRSGEVLPELRLHYRTLGNPCDEPVLVMHGTTGSGASMLAPAFGGELFGPGQPLDAARH